MFFTVYHGAVPMMPVQTASAQIDIRENLFTESIFSRAQLLTTYYFSHELDHVLQRELWIMASS